jgi:predicted Zn-dependent protease
MKEAISWKWIGFLFLAFFLAGCADAVRLGTTVGAGMGQISKEDKERLDRLAVQTERAARPMTDQEEFYLGRAVAATILGQYRLYQNDRLTRYLNEIGQSLALASDRPFTFGGYRFAVLDSNEINALSCPGGIVLVTRGMLLKAQNEEELSAILSHEIGHVSNRDGSKAIQQARWTEVITLLGTEAAKKASGAEMTKLVSLFEGSVQDGNADQTALVIMQRLGYDPIGLSDFLGRLSKEQAEGRQQGLLTTHPGLSERASQARSLIVSSQRAPKNHSERDRRFQLIIQSIR